MNPIYLFMAEGSEEVETLGVLDILRRAEMPVKLVSVTGERTVAGSHGVKVVTDLLLEEADLANASLLVLPGGLPGTYNLDGNSVLTDAIRRHYEAGKPLAAICAAPLVFGRMGLLRGRKATCYPGFEGELDGAEYTGALVERDGLFLTGKGPAAVFAFGYAIVEMLGSAERAQALRDGMLYSEVAR